MRRLSVPATRLARASAQGLAGPRATTVAGAVRRVVAVQAQDVRATRLAVRVRTAGLTAAGVDAAYARREVVRTWAMRGTLHLVAATDFGWLTGLLGPYFLARQAPRRRQLGLDEATCERAVAVFETFLGEPRTRAEIVERLAGDGIVLRGQAAPYLLGYAALTGLVCRGPEVDRDEPTYVLVRDWLGPAPALPDDEALARLATRYLAGHGPATADDLAAWSGLPLTRARAAFDLVADRLERLEAAGVPSVVLRDSDTDSDTDSGDSDDGGDPGVRLLGHFDAYLLGYRGRDLAVPAEHASAIQSGGGFVMPAVAVDGQVLGAWRQHSTKDSVAVELAPFTRLPRRIAPAIRDEVTDLGRFLGRPAVLRRSPTDQDVSRSG